MEAPVPYLKDISKLADFHWVLTNVCLKDEAYLNFYKNNTDGKMVVLDNGVNEQGVPCSIEQIEDVVLAQLKLREGFQPLLMVSGIGQILGMTIMVETGEIGRFATVGDFASYCRCVGSQKLSNGKRKGQGNVKNGNKYLAWAFVEAANFAIRYNAQIKRFYQRKQAKTNGVVAIKAVAHKLARACYYLLRDQVPFEVNKAFA